MEHEKETDPIEVHSLVVTGIRREDAELLELDLHHNLKKEDRSEDITLPLAETSLTSARLLCSDMTGADVVCVLPPVFHYPGLLRQARHFPPAHMADHHNHKTR